MRDGPGDSAHPKGRFNIIELGMTVGVMHRAPYGVWCVPMSHAPVGWSRDDPLFEIVDSTDPPIYRCKVCGQVWELERPEVEKPFPPLRPVIPGS